MSHRNKRCRAIDAIHDDYNMRLYYRTNHSGTDSQKPFWRIGNVEVGFHVLGLLEELGHHINIYRVDELLAKE